MTVTILSPHCFKSIKHGVFRTFGARSRDRRNLLTDYSEPRSQFDALTQKSLPPASHRIASQFLSHYQTWARVTRMSEYFT